MSKTINIINRWNSAILYAEVGESQREAVIALVKRGANLRGANLRTANLSSANLCGACSSAVSTKPSSASNVVSGNLPWREW